MIRKIKKVLKTLFVASGVVLFWRGAWGLMDLYIHPSDPLASFIVSVILGVAILYFSHHLFDELM